MIRIGESARRPRGRQGEGNGRLRRVQRDVRDQKDERDESNWIKPNQTESNCGRGGGVTAQKQRKGAQVLVVVRFSRFFGLTFALSESNQNKPKQTCGLNRQRMPTN